MNGFAPERTQLESLANIVESSFAAELKDKKILLVDYPLYNNVGDWLIYHGTLKLLSKLNCTIVGQYCTHNFNNLLLKKIPKNWIILLQGGGNFGDIYDVHQNLRREIISHFPDNQIISMPQSVHFNDPNNFLKEVDVYKNHPNLTIHVRDRESHAFFLEHLPESMLRLTPDMASTLLGVWPWQEGESDVLYFRRKDKEAPINQDNMDLSFDWVDMFSSIDRKIIGKIMRLARLEGQYKCKLGAAFLWLHYTNFVLKKAYRKFAPFKTVDTDRLHGMIFAILLGKTVILRDNSYGKIARYVDIWFK